ncbi:MAG: hypothetical protein R3Y11_02355 [Pseudomonadota bacterium]
MYGNEQTAQPYGDVYGFKQSPSKPESHFDELINRHEAGTLAAQDLTTLTDLLGDEADEADCESREFYTRLASYLDDLLHVLQMDGGAGLRVVRHWLDYAGAHQRLLGTNMDLAAAAALHDYRQDRMAEIAMADPMSLVRLQLEGARQWKMSAV